MAPSDRSYTTYYWSAIVSIAVLYLVPFSSYLMLNGSTPIVNNILTLKSELKVTQGHWQ